MTTPAEHQSDEDGIKANIAGIVTAVNERDLEKYGSLVTADLVNMTQYAPNSRPIATFSRQARLDELQKSFDENLYTSEASMEPTEILVAGNRGFASIDGTLRFTPTPAQRDKLRGSLATLELHLFYLKDQELGWLTERSMAIVRSRIDD